MLLLVQITFFLFWINLLPPLVHMLLGRRFAWPVDGGLLFFDKKPLFGHHKTVRGMVASVGGGALASLVMELPWWLTAMAALASMLGDLLSSFLKRRIGTEIGGSFFIVDQIFEALFPLLVFRAVTPLSWLQLIVVLAVFVPLAHLGAGFWQYLSFHPSLKNYPRLIHSTTRFREWRACHEPLARWQALLNLTSVLSDQVLLSSFFRVVGQYDRGVANALDIKLSPQRFTVDNLPDSFDGMQILLLTDLHLDGLPDLTDRIIALVNELQVDLCLIGGDIRMKTYGPIAPCLRQLRRLLPEIKARHGVFGVLGNHDCIEMTPDFEDAGITMLINDAWPLNRQGERIWLVGVDDPHYYKTDNVPRAFQEVAEGETVLFLAHSPEVYDEAANHGADLYFCGHTHGGQICLPGSGPLLTNSRAPRFTAVGRWQHGTMTGYTSRGVGASGIPLRFNCPGELTLVTLCTGRDGTPPLAG